MTYNRGLTLDNDTFVTGRKFFNFGTLCKIYLLAGVTMTHLYGLFETHEVAVTVAYPCVTGPVTLML